MRKFIIDSAPEKALIPKIIENMSFKDFKNYYDTRVDWNKTPLIHDHIITYGLFDDLIRVIPMNQKTLDIFFEYAVKIAENEKDKYFVNGVFLVYDICGLLNNFKGFNEDKLNKIKGLTNRVSELKKVPNITAFWDTIIKYISTHESYVKKNYEL